MPKVLTRAQIESYRRDGFLFPVTVMSEDEAAGFRVRYEAAETRWPDAMQGANRNNAHLNIKVLDELTHHPVILDAVEDLLGPDLLICGTVLFIKEAGDPGFVSWHQDARYMGIEPYEQATTVWLALSPSTIETGCMRMMPGSHTLGVQTHEDTYDDQNILTRGQQVNGVDEQDAVDLVLRPGQMSFHHPAVIHASAPNNGSDRRIGFVIQSFVTPAVRQTKGQTYAQVARGENLTGHLPPLARASGDMLPDDLAMRDTVNACWSDILYDGAAKRRDY